MAKGLFSWATLQTPQGVSSYTQRNVRLSGANSLLADEFTRTTSNGFGTADAGGTYTLDQGTASEFSTDGFQALIASTSTGTLGGASTKIQRLSVTAADLDIKARFSTSAWPTGAGSRGNIYARYTDTSNYYAASLVFNSGAGNPVVVQLWKEVAGVNTILQSATTIPSGGLANQFYWLRFQLNGTTLRARIWIDGSAEPSTWDVSVSDSSFSSGQVGIGSFHTTGNTNTPTISIDSLNGSNVSSTTYNVRLTGSTGSNVSRDVILGRPTVVRDSVLTLANTPGSTTNLSFVPNALWPNLQAKDIAVVACFSSGSNVSDFTASAGWTKLEGPLNNTTGNGQISALFYKAIVSGDLSSSQVFSATNSGGNVSMVLVGQIIRGASNTTPINAYVSVAEFGARTIHTSPSIQPTVDGSTLLYLAGYDNAGITTDVYSSSDPSAGLLGGYGTQFTTIALSDVKAYHYSVNSNVATTQTVTSTNSNAWNIYVLAFSPEGTSTRAYDVRVTGGTGSSVTQNVRLTGIAANSKTQDVRLSGFIAVRAQVSWAQLKIPARVALPSFIAYNTRVTGQLASSKTQDVRLFGGGGGTLTMDVRYIGVLLNNRALGIQGFGKGFTIVERSVRSQGQLTSNTTYNTRLIGTALGTSIAQEVHVTAKDTTLVSKDVRTTGAILSSTSFTAKVSGASAFSTSYSARLAGSFFSSTTQDVRLAGIVINANTVYNVRVVGETISSRSQSVKFSAQAASSLTQPIRVTGAFTSSYAQTVHFDAVNQSNRTIDVRLVAKNTTNDSRNVRLIAVTTSSAIYSIRTTGKSTTNVAASVKLSGQAITSNEWSARLRGGLIPTLVAYSVRYIGQDSSNATRTVKFVGQGKSFRSQDVKLEGRIRFRPKKLVSTQSLQEYADDFKMKVRRP